MSSPDLKSRLQRLERLSGVRQTFVSAAESRLKDAERVVVEIENAGTEIARNIRITQEEIAWLDRVSADQLHTREKYIRMLQTRVVENEQSLENARKVLDVKRAEWVEAMREQKVVERVQERRLQDWQRYDDDQRQKAADEHSIIRYVRRRTEP